MKNTETLYIASMASLGALQYTREFGVNTYPGTEYVPLSTTVQGAIARYLDDVATYQTKGDIEEAVKNTKNVLVFEVELPDDAQVVPMIPAGDPDLRNEYTYIGFKGQLPPEYIKGCETVSLDITD